MKKIKERTLLQKDIILIPCGSGGRHWVLCVILSKQKSIIVLDNLPGETVKPSTHGVHSTTDFQQEEFLL